MRTENDEFRDKQFTAEQTVSAQYLPHAIPSAARYNTTFGWPRASADTKKRSESLPAALQYRLCLALFHRYRLGQVSGLVYVPAAHHGYVVGQQLQRHYRHQRHQHLVNLRNLDGEVNHAR